MLDGWKGGGGRASKSSLGFASNLSSKAASGPQFLVLHQIVQQDYLIGSFHRL